MRRIVPIALAAAAPALLAVSFLTGSTPDEEEFRWGILSSFLHLRALGQGTFGTWTSMLGFGIPQPMVPNFDMHPLVPLLAVVSPATWARLLLVAHTLLGAAGMWQLGRMLRLTPLVRAVCVFTFLLATPTQNYTLSDFWPSHYVMWTSAPWLLLIAWRMLEATGRDVRRYSVMLGVCAGLVLATTHPGHVPVYGVVVLAVAVAQWRAVLARWRWLLAAALIALAIASPGLTQLATERLIFNPDLGISKLPDPLPPSAVRDLFLRPFSLSEHAWQIDVINGGTRTLFFGGPFTVLCLLGLTRLGRSHPALAIGVTLASVLLFTPLLPMTFLSRYHFRDPLLLCAIPLAGLAADHLLRLPRARLPVLLFLAAQIGIVTAAALPFLDGVWQPEARQALWFRGASAETGTADALLALMPAPGRLAYSPQIDYEVSERARLQEGLGVNALAYRGIPVVNGSFKGISTDVLWPDDRLFYGRIRLPQALVASDEGLDLLGIRYVLANPGEALAPGLRERGSVRKSNGMPALLYENANAAPGAFVVAAQPAELPVLQPYPDCIHDRFLCMDLGPLAQLRRQDRLEITRRGSRIEIGIEAGPTPRTLVLVEMFRPEWRATSDGRDLETVSVGPGLLGVMLPTDVTSVRLDYRAPLYVAASILAWGVLAVGLVIVFSRPASTTGAIR